MSLSDLYKSVTFDYRMDENQFPIIEPIQIEGDLIDTPTMSYEYDDDGRVIARVRDKWFKRTPKLFLDKKKEISNPYFHQEMKEWAQHRMTIEKIRESFNPEVKRYAFDVEISGRHRKDGKLAPVSKSCGNLYDPVHLELYKHEHLDEYKMHRSRCTRQNCPVCFRLHGSIRGQSVASKLWQMAWVRGWRLRHYSIMRAEDGEGKKVDPPKSFEELKEFELKIREHLERHHRDGRKDLGYTLTIHPYTLVKTCDECGADVPGGKKTKRCPVCKKSWRFHYQRWIRKWHWHLITNFVCDMDALNGDQNIKKDCFQIQHLSKKSKKYPGGFIHSEKVLARVLSYEFSHAMYTPFKARDICRFLGLFHHSKYKLEWEMREVLVLGDRDMPYYKVKTYGVNVDGLKVTFETLDEPELSEEGQKIYLTREVKICTKCEIRTKKQRDKISGKGSKREKKSSMVDFDKLYGRKRVTDPFIRPSLDVDMVLGISHT